MREFAAAAHEEELRRALLPLRDTFQQWERGEVSSGELSDSIHQFHQGPARYLFVRYNTNRLEIPLAYAIVTGVVDKVKVPQELLEHLARAIDFYEEQQASS